MTENRFDELQYKLVGGLAALLLLTAAAVAAIWLPFADRV